MYESTRGNYRNQSAAQVIVWGMVPGGGLFVPSEFPKLQWEQLQGLSYIELAQKIMALYLPDLSKTTIERAANVYTSVKFGTENPAPLVNMDKFGVLELWHGPTSAFKDMALQVLPHLLPASLKTINDNSEVLILVATSGDTGKAALEGFKDVPGTNIIVFYPDKGVSVIQESQMITTDGHNTYVIGVEGNFDHCQTAVKEIFNDKEFSRKLQSEKNMIFSSANSINWGRLLPQIVYYIWAYLQAIDSGKVKPGQTMNVVVPTGNFGNILAAYYAKQMGIPLGKLICASNKNNVLTEFFETGIYQTKRPFYLTMAPSMDILVSSNLERFIYEMNGRNSKQVKRLYDDLANNGTFSIDNETLSFCRSNIYAGWADEKDILDTIKRSYDLYNYVFDPHTAVAMKVYDDYVQRTGDDSYSVIVSTASPFKFAASVLNGIAEELKFNSEWEALHLLSSKTGWEIPEGLKNLDVKQKNKILKCKPSAIPQAIDNVFQFKSKN